MVTNNTTDIEKKIPTYVIHNTGESVTVRGNGYYGESLPNLVFLRNKEYRFLFYNKNSIIDLYDKKGNLLRATDESTWDLPFVMLLGGNFPNEIHYKPRFSDDNQFGVISLRDENNINGCVIAYGYCNGASVTDSRFYDVNTNIDGIFSLYFENSGKQYYSVDYDLSSSGGFDSLLVDRQSPPTHQTMLKFKFKTKLGSLMLNSFTTLFYYLEKRYLVSDYKKINSMICDYFELSSEYQILTDDPIQKYLTGNLELSNYVKLLLLTSLIEYVSIQLNENLQEQLYEKLVNDIIVGGRKFDFMDIDFLEMNEYEEYQKFKDVFYVLSVRLKRLTTIQKKKRCVFEDALSLIFKFRNVIIKKTISYDSFLKSDLKVISGKIKIPEIPKTLLLTYVDSSKIAPFGKYAKINLTETLIKSIFNQPLPSEPEVVNKLLNKTLYLKQDFNTNYCYRITDFINYDYELPIINTDDVVQAFDDEIECCDHERFLRETELVKSQVTINEQQELSLFDFVLFNGDKTRMHEIKFTNKNKPYEKIDFLERFYVNEHISTKFRHTPPVFIGVSKEYSKNIQKIKITFDGKVPNYKVDRIRYDYDTIKIKTTNVVDNIVSFQTNHAHGYESGDTLVIKNSSKDGLLNGHQTIVNVTEYTITIEYLLPQNVTYDDIRNTYGEIESLKFSKIYCDVTDFTKGDLLVFNKLATSEKFEVNSIKQDYLGMYLSVSGIVPRNSNVFTKKNSPKNLNEILEYSYEPDATYFNLDLDLEQYHLWIYDPVNPGDAANTRFDALISHVEILPKIITTPSFQFNRPSMSDTVYHTPTPVNDNSSDIPYVSDPTDVISQILPTPTPIVNQDKTNIEIDLTYDPSISNKFSQDSYPEIFPDTNLPTQFSTEVEITEPTLSGIKLTESYHFNRMYLRNEFELKIENNNYDEIYDWNGDGTVGSDELKILERFILTSPETIEEYNENRGNYPIAKILPTTATATYACQEYCCHDDYTETYDFNEDDALIYDAFQAYIDSLDDDTPSEFANFSYEYLVLTKQGITPPLENDIMYMPTDPRQSNLCADYTATGGVNSDDSNIYYAYYLYMQAHSSAPSSLQNFVTYYDQLVSSGIVPSLLNPIKLLPSLQSDNEILTDDGYISKGCENISWKDLKIYNDWLRQGQPTDLEIFNQNRESDTPVACFLPQSGDQAPDFGDDNYDDFGEIDNPPGGPLFNRTYSGISNL